MLLGASSAFSVIATHQSGKAQLLGMSAVAEEANNSASKMDTSDSSPSDFVERVLNSLKSDNGSQTLLNSSTDSWRSKIYDALGAPYDSAEGVVVQSLDRALRRTDKQWGLLVTEDYAIEFPSDPVNYEDGSGCWIECRLRSTNNADDLLVAMGCQLEPAPNGGAGGWLINSIDWQDFRDDFSPGLGRDEWVPLF